MAKKLIASMEQPELVHYSMLISMISYSSRRETGMGDEAYEIVKPLLDSDMLKDTKDGMCLLCNPILTCYAEEALFAKEKGDMPECQAAQKKALRLWEYLKKSPDPAVAANPITYSIMMKMFRDLNQAEKVQQILDAMESENMNTSDNRTRIPPPLPVSVHYNIALSAWSKSTHPKAGERAIQLLNRMEQNTGTRFPLPNKIAYTSALDAVLRSSTAEDVVERIDQMLMRFENLNDPSQSPDAVTYNVIFSGLARRVENERNPNGKKKLAEQTEHLFKTLRKRSSAFNVAGQRRMYQYYNSCIRAWAKSESQDYFANVLRLIHDMEVDTIASSVPDSTTYEIIISSLLSNPDESAVNRACELFLKMENSGVPRSRLSAESFIELALQCRFPGSPVEADESFVQIVMDRFKVNSNGNRIPDSFEYRTVFRYLLSRQMEIVDTNIKEKIARRMELLLRVLVKNSEHFCLVEGANMCQFYNDCIKAWAFSSSPLSKDRSFNLLRDMEEISDSTKGKAIIHGALVHAQPKSDTYEHIFHDLARSREATTLSVARMLFEKIDGKNIPISLPILNSFLEILVKAGNMEEAERTIKEMEDRSGTEIGAARPDHTSYIILLRGYQQSQETYMLAHKLLCRMEEMSNTSGITYVRPTMFNKMIDLWAESNAPGAVEHVEELIKKLKAPTSANYLSLQKAWVNSDRPDSTQRVESILVQLQSDFDSGRTLSKPSVDNFAIVSHCWAKNGDFNRAKAILSRMESLYKLDGKAHGHLKPTSACYETLLSGLNKSGHPEAVQNSTTILDSMETGHASVLPSLACYHQVMNTIRKSRVRYKASRAFALLQRMKNASQAGENMFVRPTHDTFAAVLECCCGDAKRAQEDKENAFDFAMKTMQEYIDHTKSIPRRDAYLKFLQAARDLMCDREKRDAAVLSIFCDTQHPCPRPYLVHPAIRSALKMTVSKDTLKQIEQMKH
jgi:pentatricopeptide repeat protein